MMFIGNCIIWGIPAFFNIMAGYDISQYGWQIHRYFVKDHVGSIHMTTNSNQEVDGSHNYCWLSNNNLFDFHF